jgi:MFS family permease
MLQVVLAMLVMPTLGWRWLLALSSIPSLCFLLVCAWLPESPRYMAAGGHSDQATSQPIETPLSVRPANCKSPQLSD